MARPARSDVRIRLAQMLFVVGRLTAYDAHKHYIRIFSATTQRNIYYQLKRGVELGEFTTEEVIISDGNFSWGTTARKVYYSLHKEKKPELNERIKEYFDGIKNEKSKTTKA